MSWYNQGYNKVEERAKEIDEAMKGYTPQLMIKDTDSEVYVSILTPEPITYYQHFLKSIKKFFTCPDNGDTSIGTCPLCAMGNKAGFQGAYLVIDHRYEKWEKDGKTFERQHTLKVAKFGIRVLKSLQKMDAKLKKGSQIQAPVPNGILGVPFDVVRSGTGTDTQYAFNALQPNDQYFPRNYVLPEIEENGVKRFQTEQELIIEAVKPMSPEKIMEKIGGGVPNQQAQQPYGQPAQFGQPQGQFQQPQQQFNQQYQQPQGQGQFQQSQGQFAPQQFGQAPQQGGMFQQAQNQQPPSFLQGNSEPQGSNDDADVIDFSK